MKAIVLTVTLLLPVGAMPVAAQSLNPSGGVRASAQKGLEYLVRSSQAWTKKHRCYGCHVQAVTLEALTIGRHNQYTVREADLNAMTDALLLGVTAGGRRTGAAFQGAAWARYDEWVNQDRTPQVLKYAKELLNYQGQDGSVRDDDRRPPVVAGTLQTTFQAMQTWRQAFARTADDVWLQPIRKAEQYMSARAEAWAVRDQTLPILDINYALMGLVAAGVGRSESSSTKLQSMLAQRQNKDGGFGLQGPSDALATGQTLYALRLAGYSDKDPVVRRGMAWLTEKQERNGGWRTVSSKQHGADKGEAMWGVLGLVSVDVMSLSIGGLVNGQHLSKWPTVTVSATDNGKGQEIESVEVLVDDLRVAKKKGAELSARLKVSQLPTGRHFLDVVARNNRGQRSSRRIEFYTGDVFLTDLGSRFDEGRQTTEVSFRSLTAKGQFKFQVLTHDNQQKVVHESKAPARFGAMTIRWNGTGLDKKALPRGRYNVRVSYLDHLGKARHQEQTVIFHDRSEVQKARYGEIQGRLSTSRGSAGVAAGAKVELVDEDGRVVQSVRSTRQGNYRFKNVDKGKYRVRIKKRGFRDEEAAVEAAQARAPAQADLTLE